MIQITHSDGRAGVENALTTDKSFSTIHSNSPHHVLTQVLRNLEHEPDLVVEHLKSSKDRRQSLVESDIHDGSNNLADLPDWSGTSELIGDLPLRLASSRRLSRGLLSRGRSGGSVPNSTVQKKASRGSAWSRPGQRVSDGGSGNWAPASGGWSEKRGYKPPRRHWWVRVWSTEGVENKMRARVMEWMKGL